VAGAPNQARDMHARSPARDTYEGGAEVQLTVRDMWPAGQPVHGCGATRELPARVRSVGPNETNVQYGSVGTCDPLFGEQGANGPGARQDHYRYDAQNGVLTWDD